MPKPVAHRGIWCPSCGGDMEVIRTRPGKLRRVRRLRCLNQKCQVRVTTEERIILPPSLPVTPC